jgi:hypothetical protein
MKVSNVTPKTIPSIANRVVSYGRTDGRTDEDAKLVVKICVIKGYYATQNPIRAQI